MEAGTLGTWLNPVVGSLSSGPTALAVGLGTEFAFRAVSVRYASFPKLAEMIDGNYDVLGPVNIGYWPWVQAQVLIIDDVAPVGPDRLGLRGAIGASPELDLFCKVLDQHAWVQSARGGTRAAAAHDAGPEAQTWLGQRDTVWVLEESDELDRWLAEIQDRAGSSNKPVIVRLQKTTPGHAGG